MSSLLLKFNHSQLWQRTVNIKSNSFLAPSLDRLVSLMLHKFGWYGRQEMEIIRRLTRPGMHVLDIGANQGLYTLTLASLVAPSGKVVAYEPAPDLFHALRNNLSRNPGLNVTVHNLALGSARGQLTLAINPLNSGDNRLNAASPKSNSNVTVPVEALDTIIEMSRVDLVKMDVQGWELQVFTGMSRVLRENRDIVLFFEFWPFGLREAGDQPLALIEFLENLGFKLWWMNPSGRCEQFSAANYLDGKIGKKYTDLIACRDAALINCLHK